MTAHLPSVTIVDADRECDARWWSVDAPIDWDHCQRDADKGRHVLIDLQADSDVASLADRLTAIDAAGDGRCMLGNTLRFDDSIQTVKQQLDDGRLGEACLLRMHSWHAPDGSWRSQPDRLLAQLDLACWIMQEMPETLYARSMPIAEASQRDDYWQLHLGYSGGSMALIDDCDSLPEGDKYFCLSLIGSTGAAYADDHHNMQLLYRGGSPQARNTRPTEWSERRQVEEFLAAIHEARRPSVPLADWQRANSLLSAVTVSAEDHLAVQL